MVFEKQRGPCIPFCLGNLFSERREPIPDMSYSARNANGPERRLIAGFGGANTLKAD
jgi:hypothetical protein